ELNPRVALVTGGAKRVGRAIVVKLAQNGYDVAFTYLSSQTEADELVAAVASRGRRAIAIRADFTDPTAAVDQIDRTMIHPFNRLHVLVNNASLYEPSALSQTNPEQLKR